MALQRELMATWVLETEMNAALQGTVTWERYKLQNQVWAMWGMLFNITDGTL